MAGLSLKPPPIAMMDMHSRTQYLFEVHKNYQHARKAERTRLLNEAVERTGLNRKYLIRKFRKGVAPTPRKRTRRSTTYGEEVHAMLVKLWRLFDHPCGQRLAPLLSSQLDHLRAIAVVKCDDAVAHKLKKITPATIDRKLRTEKVRHRLSQRRGRGSGLLFQRIPVKLSTDWDRELPGNLQLDFVMHCGQTIAGNHLNTLSVADIATGWWEGAAIMGRTKYAVRDGLRDIRLRLPFTVREVHPDNDPGLVNHILYRYCTGQGIAFSRSRPHRKNDNAWVEQRNWTHVRRVVGYLRYDTWAEQSILNELYRNLGLYRNYFLPTMKLSEKTRVGSKVHRKYDVAQTPYQRVLASPHVDAVYKERLQRIYASLNPKELKKRIDDSRETLTVMYRHKQNSLSQTDILKKIPPRMVTSQMIQ